MSTVLRRSYLRAKNNVISSGNNNGSSLSSALFAFMSRTFSSDDKTDNPDFINSTILIENGLNVQELPVVVRKLKDLSEINNKADVDVEDTKSKHDSVNYNLIQSEFKQCIDLRDVFSLLSKCTRITPNIALGAMERIYNLEKNPSLLNVDINMHINMAKGAILDKLLKVVTRTEDTQTILNILNTESMLMEPYKYKFCDELLLRVVDNKLTLDQLCEFANFLIRNKTNPRYYETIDKLWVGFIDKESEIHENNIVNVFKLLPGLKVSKRTVLSLLEQKLFDLWSKMKAPVMQDILNIFVEEKYSSLQSFCVIGRWLHTSIHTLDEDALLDVVTKLTRLNYTDDQVEKAVEKYTKLKQSRIESHILIVGILNYCMQFHIRNEVILNVCRNYFIEKGSDVPPSFVKSLVYPFGYLHFKPEKCSEFFSQAEKFLNEKFDKMSSNDLSSTTLSLIYIGYYPLKLVSRLLSPEYVVKVNDPKVMKKLHLIDTALSLECVDYVGPLLPRDQWSKPIAQDRRITNIVDKIRDTLVVVAGGPDKLSTDVQIPYIYSDETYLIDVMLHPAGLGSNTFNWKSKSAKNENTAILIHLPDHYCSDNKQLIGPQVMRRKHLALLGMKVVSLKYTAISQFYTTYNNSDLRKYIIDSIDNAESSG